MKSQFRHSLLLGLLLVIALFSNVPQSVFAAGDTAYLYRSTGSFQKGDSFTVSVDGNVTHITNCFLFVCVNKAIFSAQGSLAFPQDLLKVTSVSSSNATFHDITQITPNNSTGSIVFNQSNGAIGAKDQPIHLFNVTFQAIASGTATLAFGTVKYGSNSAATSGATYTIASPAPPPAPNPAPVQNPATNPAPNPAPVQNPATNPAPNPAPVQNPATNTPNQTSTSPSIDDDFTDEDYFIDDADIAALESLYAQELTDLQPTSSSEGGLKIENVDIQTTRAENSVAWTLSNVQATPVLSIGKSKNALKEFSVTPNPEDGSYKYTFDGLKEGTLYFFSIKASTSDNLSGATYTGSFTTRGYPVQLIVQQNGFSLARAKVQIDNRTFTTDNNGVITTELPSGQLTATITSPEDSHTSTVKFTVNKISLVDTKNITTQKIKLDSTIAGEHPATEQETSPFVYIAGGIAALVVIGGLVFTITAFLRRRTTTTTGYGDIDAGQLSEQYGIKLENRVQLMPEPNLAVGTDTSMYYQAESLPVDFPNQAPAQETISSNPPAVPASNISEEPSPESQTATAPVSIPLPLPPQETTVVQPVTQPTIQPPEAVPVSVSSELLTVESSEYDDSNEATAIYDAATGELDIIHHHNTPQHEARAFATHTANQNPLTGPPLPPQQGSPA